MENKICLKCAQSPRMSRGLCKVCYGRFSTVRTPLTLSQRVAYEKELMDAGLLLPKRPGTPEAPPDVFSDAADNAKE